MAHSVVIWRLLIQCMEEIASPFYTLNYCWQKRLCSPLTLLSRCPERRRRRRSRRRLSSGWRLRCRSLRRLSLVGPPPPAPSAPRASCWPGWWRKRPGQTLLASRRRNRRQTQHTDLIPERRRQVTLGGVKLFEWDGFTSVFSFSLLPRYRLSLENILTAETYTCFNGVYLYVLFLMMDNILVRISVDTLPKRKKTSLWGTSLVCKSFSTCDLLVSAFVDALRVL